VPRSVRNFWIEGIIDGRESKLEGGPANKTGGMSVDIFQRENGNVLESINIRCWKGEEDLILEIIDGQTGTLLFRRRTQR
jgi:hypothetical protein